jgi:malonyl-CoA O-methyltransferase
MWHDLGMTNVVQEFSRFANLYDRYNIIQTEVAKRLISMIDGRDYSSVVDIGCGSGSIYKELIESSIVFNDFMALDLSKEMLDIHPNSPKIKKLSFDFNSQKSFRYLKEFKYDLLLSSSALQWSSSLDMTLNEISQLSKECYFSIFTSNTFISLHQLAGIKSPIYSKDIIENSINKYFSASFELVRYQLSFSDIYEMLRYIKRSGVSGGKRQLSYKDMKNIIQNYPLDYLEFEVLFISASSKNYALV